MKVGKSRGRPVARKTGNEKGHRGPVGIRHGVFLEALQSVEERQLRETLDAFLPDIDAAAQRFAKSPTYANLRQYRTLVQKFMSTVIKGSHRVDSQYTFDRYGSRKVYKTVQLVDQYLDEMKDLVLSRHRPILDLVQRLDEIRGLLCDMYQ